MFKSSTLQASVFMGKEDSENLRSIKNTGNNLTMKQMFDIVGDEEVISLLHTKVYVFPDSLFCLGKR